jgi:hypothetical protein
MDDVRVHRREANAVGGARRRAPLGAAVVALLAALIVLLLAAEAQAYAPGALIYAKRIGTSTAPAGAFAVAAGPNGVTAVAGWRANSSVPAGIVTMVAKYSATGQRRWLKTYTTTGGTAEAVAFDRSGNVYVAATLYRSSEDIGLLKYDAAGHLKWKHFYDGPAAGDDWPEAVAVDRSGNVVVAGRSYAASGRVGVVVVKYRPNGDLAWPQAARYDSDPLDPNGGSTNCKALALDGNGNAYVTGWSEYFVSGEWIASAITIKFAAVDGARRWGQIYEARHNPTSWADHMTLRGSAVVVTGSTGGSADNERDALIVKYGLGGKERYWKEWGVGDGLGEFFSGVVLDGKGNAFVTGDQWLLRGTGSNKAITMKINATLSKVVWKKTYQPKGKYANGFFIARDGLGNLFVSGVRQGSTGAHDFLTMKYSPTGVRKWLKAWSGGGSGSDEPNGLVLGTKGGAYVAGQVTAKGDFSQAVLLKYRR